MDFEFYYDKKVRYAHDKETALEIFRAGGFYQAICYFTDKQLGWFRLIETEEDIISL